MASAVANIAVRFGLSGAAAAEGCSLSGPSRHGLLVESLHQGVPEMYLTRWLRVGHA